MALEVKKPTAADNANTGIKGPDVNQSKPEASKPDVAGALAGNQPEKAEGTGQKISLSDAISGKKAEADILRRTNFKPGNYVMQGDRIIEFRHVDGSPYNNPPRDVIEHAFSRKPEGHHGHERGGFLGGIGDLFGDLLGGVLGFVGNLAGGEHTMLGRGILGLADEIGGDDECDEEYDRCHCNDQRYDNYESQGPQGPKEYGPKEAEALKARGEAANCPRKPGEPYSDWEARIENAEADKAKTDKPATPAEPAAAAPAPKPPTAHPKKTKAAGVPVPTPRPGTAANTCKSPELEQAKAKAYDVEQRIRDAKAQMENPQTADNAKGYYLRGHAKKDGKEILVDGKPITNLRYLYNQLSYWQNKVDKLEHKPTQTDGITIDHSSSGGALKVDN